MKISDQLRILLVVAIMIVGSITILYGESPNTVSTGVGSFTLLETISGILTTITTIIAFFFKNKSDKRQTKLDQGLQLAEDAIKALSDKTLTQDELSYLIKRYKELRG